MASQASSTPEKPAARKAGVKSSAKAPPEEPARFVYGPRSVAMLLSGVLRPTFRRRSPATAQVFADWELIVGPQLAAQTLPQKLFAGTLTIICNGPVAMELQHLAEPLMARINAHLGHIAVTRLRFHQGVLPESPPPPAPPPPLARAASARAVADLPEGALRDALERLGAEVLRPRKE